MRTLTMAVREKHASTDGAYLDACTICLGRKHFIGSSAAAVGGVARHFTALTGP